ncbi:MULTISPECIES: IlvGEDA operon leader peptide [Xenorhabdus]|uniref:ilv operon leader peptide n=1 Tax=Xenorhabdus budapestensis TaxID=290110 RepID=A0ABX7VGU8_XENBU|nr:IlvGEDA operon leader peptide [Xenorhabdus sp. Flor]QTL39705.1 IlvGEDA operon leader peptide [Xenorhabdus budapestensis]
MSKFVLVISLIISVVVIILPCGAALERRKA